MGVAEAARGAAEGNRVEEATRGFDEGLAICARAGAGGAAEVGYRCLLLALQRMDFHGLRHELQPAIAASEEARRQAWVGGLLPEYAHAVSRRAILESFRDAHGASRAHAEEVVLLGEPCSIVQEAREFLAETAIERHDFPEARRLLTAVERCPDCPGRFGLVGLGALAELARDPRDPQGEQLLAWLDGLTEALARAGRLGSGALGSMLRGASRVERDPPRARALFRQALQQVASAPAGSPRDEKARLHAHLGLIAEAAARGAHDEALANLLALEGVPAPAGCLVGVVQDFVRTLFLVRGPDGHLRGRFERSAGPRSAPGEPPPLRLPAAMLPALRGCGPIAVVATAPVFGAANLLPPELPWAYLGAVADPAPPPPTARRRAGAPGEVAPAPRRRLVVSAPDQPVGLQLPLLRRSWPVAAAGEDLVELHGARATPAAVLAGMAAADAIELHVHGVVDPRVSDAAALVLSQPPGDGAASPFLTADAIQRVRLARRPLVLLGACQAARSARYGPLRWNLPAAFLRAGAALVVASPSPVADADAGAFFDRLRARIARGESPALALRDERMRALAREPDHWSRDLVLFA